MDKETKEEQGRAGFILPIMCPHCQKEIELGMGFELLPPKQDKEDVTKEKNKEASPEGDADAEEKK